MTVTAIVSISEAQFVRAVIYAADSLDGSDFNCRNAHQHDLSTVYMKVKLRRNIEN
jgi:hypothetical protein